MTRKPSTSQMTILGLVALMLLLPLGAFAQEITWTQPIYPDAGDVITLYYDARLGTLEGSSNLNIYWGIDAVDGIWTLPPSDMYPNGSTTAGNVVTSPMIPLGDQIFMVTIETTDTLESLHYYFGNGTVNDDNDGDDWNYNFVEAVTTQMKHIFTYDPRSSRASVRIEDTEEVYLAGDYNGWSTSDTRMVKNNMGVYTYDWTLPVGTHRYKFVVNGTNWTQDPDNLLTEGGENDNSLARVVPFKKPVFIKLKNTDAAVLAPGDAYQLQMYIFSSGYSGVFESVPVLTVDNLETAVNWYSGLGLYYQTLNLDEGIHDLKVEATDNIGRRSTKNLTVAVHDPADGFLAVDPMEDDKGMGDYRYPEGLWGAADLRYLKMEEVNGGEEIQFTLGMTRIEPETRVLLQINSNLQGSTSDHGIFGIELQTPEWTGNGVQICLADPSASCFDSEVHNVVITGYGPVESTYPFYVDQIALDNQKFVFSIPVSELEAIMGSYNRPWYFMAASFLQGPEGTAGYSWEVDAAHGGIDDTNDPDVFDMMFVDLTSLQDRILSYYETGYDAAIDNVGRGFAEVAPEDIGADIGSLGPVITVLTGTGFTSQADWDFTGVVGFETSGDVAIYHTYEGGSQTYNVSSVVDTFIVPLTLVEGVNTFKVAATEGENTSFSGLSSLELQVDHLLKPNVVTTIESSTVVMDASGTIDPDGETLMYHWTADPDNPETVSLSVNYGYTTSFTLPSTLGEYYFDYEVTAPDGDTRVGRTFITVAEDTVMPFDMNRPSQWVLDAVVYEVFPRGYFETFTLDKFTERMYHPEWMGYNAIWFTPIYPGPTGHGYEITDYRNINPEFGTLEDFDELVQEAHARGLKVILDVVYNHTALAHPFFQNTDLYGEYSPYYDWYMRDEEGNYEYLFNWATMPSLNLDNSEAREYFIRTCEWWVENYEVDGFRCDVAWGVERRHPTFWTEWRERLRSIKPELLLVGEAPTIPTGDDDFPEGENYFSNRFDLVYDWYLHHESSAAFTKMWRNPPLLSTLHDAITNNDEGFGEFKRAFRFLENHDESRYIDLFGPEKARLANILYMTIPGVPLVYAGQEYGEYSYRDPISREDPNEFENLIYRLTWAKNRLSALNNNDIVKLPNTSGGSVYSYARYTPGEHAVIAIHNFTGASASASLTVPLTDWGFGSNDEYIMSEILRDESQTITGTTISPLSVTLDAYESRLYVVGDTLFTVDSPEAGDLIPAKYELMPNYPNPFNPSTTINFHLPNNSFTVLRVFNILGQQVMKEDFGKLQAGRYSYSFDGSEMSSGIYFYRLEAGPYVSTRKMVLVK